MKRQIILASASPRRRELLGQIGLSFTVRAAGGEEKSGAELPWERVEELSFCKAQETARTADGAAQCLCGLFTAEQLEQFDALETYGYDFYFPQNADGTPLDWNDPAAEPVG